MVSLTLYHAAGPRDASGNRPPPTPEQKVAAVAGATIAGMSISMTASAAGTATTATFMAGPIGFLMVECEGSEPGVGYTWDCWKPIVRDTSGQPSSGMSLRCLAAHPNVRSVSVEKGELWVDNVFDERFHLALVHVEGVTALHATPFFQ